MKKWYPHIFFDLDHTLWDHEKNSAVVLFELYSELKLKDFGIPSSEEFHSRFVEVNGFFWEQYRHGKIEKSALREERFAHTFAIFGVQHPALVSNLSKAYLQRAPKGKHLIPGAKDVLDYFAGKSRLHIITNGFKEVQRVKLEAGGIFHFFDQIIISEEAGFHKPRPEIFHFALKKAGAKIKESLMVGDNYPVDVEGALEIGMDAAFFNPEGRSEKGNSTYDLHHLMQLKDWVE